ncbi:DUF502 domain-containing protein [Variovorax sp. J22R133]|uniref:DUF502 domain-containing protein n=1 Tax=Variovorax brevis TaxID=3053503 RepID=UPI002576C6F1|nr:DUF502 domain-containing protein [Variovorax sp. J22R133]MDM0111540.1 DUF502 domain-containing protein [Variovorax sp. J22R133]
MHAIWGFVKTTFIGGVLVLLPIYLAVLLLAKAMQGMVALVKPIVSLVPVEAGHHNIVAIALVLLASFLVGLAMRTWAGKRLGHWVNVTLLERIPGYSFIRSVMRRSFGDETAEFEVALVEFDDQALIAFVVEQHDDGRYTIFVPGSPTPLSGAVYVVAPQRVRVLDASLVQALQAMGKWGAGTRDLLKAMRPLEASTIHGAPAVPPA